MKKASRTLLLLILAALFALSAACGKPADDAEATLPPSVFIPQDETPAPTEPPVPEESPSPEPTVPEGGGILRLQVNPDILVVYDAEGTVVDILAWNSDGADLLRDYPGFDGKNFRTVIGELVAVIGSSGYFDLPATATDADAAVITIELRPGSALPEGTTLEDIVSDVNTVMDANHWTAQVDTVDNSAPADRASASDADRPASATDARPVRATPKPGSGSGSNSSGGNSSGGQTPAATNRPASPTAPPAATQAPETTQAPAPAKPTAMPASSTDTGTVTENASSSSIPSAPAPTPAPAPDLDWDDADVEDASAT